MLRDPIDEANDYCRERAFAARGHRNGLTRVDFSMDPMGDVEYEEYCAKHGYPCDLPQPEPGQQMPVWGAILFGVLSLAPWLSIGVYQYFKGT